MRVLLAVVDEEERNGIRDLLIKEDVTITLSTESGKEAFQSVLNVETRPDIIIADLCLPGMDAIDLLDQMHEKFLSVPVVVLSYVAHSTMVSLVSQSGADAIIIKPYNLQSLYQRICMILGVDIEKTGNSLEDAISRKVRQTLLDLGVPAGNRGFEFLEWAVVYCLQNTHATVDLSHRLIATVGDHFGKSYSAMERALRRVVTETQAASRKGDKFYGVFLADAEGDDVRIGTKTFVKKVCELIQGGESIE